MQVAKIIELLAYSLNNKKIINTKYLQTNKIDFKLCETSTVIATRSKPKRRHAA